MKKILSLLRNYYKPIFVLILITTNISLNAKSQNGSLTLDKANLYYSSLKFAQAAPLYENYINQNQSTSPDIIAKLADCYWNIRKLDMALQTYEKAMKAGTWNPNEKEMWRLSEMYARQLEYDKAARWLKQIPAYSVKANAYSSKTILEKMKSDSALWKLSLLNIDTQYREFSPYVINNSMLFSSNRPQINKTKAFGWDGKNYSKLWKISLADVKPIGDSLAIDSLITLSEQKAISRNIAGLYECGDTKSLANINKILTQNIYLNGNGKQSGIIVSGLNKQKLNAGNISIDQNNHIYFSSNYDKAGKDNLNRIRIMEGIYENGQISNIKALPFGDPDNYSVMHPAINSDGTILVFSSDKPDKNGKYNLYYSTRQNTNEKWGKMNLLNDKINTDGNEVFPVISSDSILFFSSDGLAGLGGLDIYKIPLMDAIQNASNVKPAHISYPINSSSDDFGLFQINDSTGFLTSDRLNNDDNIYNYSYITPVRGSFYLEGDVFDSQNSKPLANATVFIYNKSNDSVYIAKTNANGHYSYKPSTTSSEFILKAVAEQHIPDCTTKTLPVEIINHDSTIIVNKLTLGSLNPGDKLKISYIHYDFDKYYIRADARPILDSLVNILNNYPIKVELGSHTDSRGSFAYNDKLSQKRAEAAVNYLVKKGIDPNRITAKGYGERQLLNRCADGVKCSEAEHQANRRTEIKILDIKSTDKDSKFNFEKYKNGQVINKSELPKDFFKECE